MNVAGLFAGIGGFELGLAQAGHEASLFCEILPTAHEVIDDRFPGVQLLPDIINLKSFLKDISVITMGCGRVFLRASDLYATSAIPRWESVHGR